MNFRVNSLARQTQKYILHDFYKVQEEAKLMYGDIIQNSRWGTKKAVG